MRVMMSSRIHHEKSLKKRNANARVPVATAVWYSQAKGGVEYTFADSGTDC